MKTILEVAFSGECKAPVFTTRRGKHFFCGEPAPEGESYCRACGQRMHRPTVHYADSASLADGFAGGKTKPVATTETSAGAYIQSTDTYMHSPSGNSRKFQAVA